MVVFGINAGCFGSTGKIMLGILRQAESQSIEVYSASTNRLVKKKPHKNHFFFEGFVPFWIHRILGFITGYELSFSFFSTRKLIRILKKVKPDIVHLHILHSWYLNAGMLFRYLKKSNMKVVWTLHDCWAFTGHCPYFSVNKCEKWKEQCFECPRHIEYPRSVFDNSKKMYKIKKKLFTSLDNMVIVTPSQWLADLAKESFLGKYPIKVIHNGIDLSVFQPTQSDFRQKYHCENKYLLLGVAFNWEKRKGLDVFLELSKRLDPERYQIVLVGTNDKVDQLLPDNIISIHRTQNQKELAEIYTAADLFVNPTREENFPTVNMESLACGTPVLTFRTGGSPEIIDETCGDVVDCDDVDGLIEKIGTFAASGIDYSAACVKHARLFDAKTKFNEYTDLYFEEFSK